MHVRSENQTDAAAISALITAAFVDAEHADGTEAEIVERLRASDGLSISLVAVEDGEIVGHVAFSPVSLGRASGYYGLGPVAVHRDHRRRGVGAELIRTGLDQLRDRGAKGCVVLGDPAYYRRFGFACDERVTLAGVPAEYFQILRLTDGGDVGAVRYHPAFGIE